MEKCRAGEPSGYSCQERREEQQNQGDADQAAAHRSYPKIRESERSRSRNRRRSHQRAVRTPTPGGFWQRVRKRLKRKELCFCTVQKSAQHCEKRGDRSETTKHWKARTWSGVHTPHENGRASKQKSC